MPYQVCLFLAKKIGDTGVVWKDIHFENVNLWEISQKISKLKKYMQKDIISEKGHLGDITKDIKIRKKIWRKISKQKKRYRKRYRLWEAILGRYSKETETIWEWHSSGIEKV